MKKTKIKSDGHRLAKQRAAKRSPKPIPKCENTYRLEPAEGNHFSPQKVEVAMKGVIDNHPGLEQYNSVRSKVLVKDLTFILNPVFYKVTGELQYTGIYNILNTHLFEIDTMYISYNYNGSVFISIRV
jgi:hypothetical protein